MQTACFYYIKLFSLRVEHLHFCIFLSFLVIAFLPTVLKMSFLFLSIRYCLLTCYQYSIDRDREGVVLQCESKGWYLQPEVIWLDDEGSHLCFYLYTVSSRVTVEKRPSNNFTCRVQQNNINQTRETHIIVPGKIYLFCLRFWIYFQCIIITIFSVA